MKTDELADWLKHNQPAPIYMVCGDEPLQSDEAASAIRGHAREHGYAERTVLQADNRSFNWQNLEQEKNSPSLFSPKRLIEVRMGEVPPGADGGRILRRYTENAPDDLVLLLVYEKNNKKTRDTLWYKSIQQAGRIVTADTIRANELPRWLRARAQKQGVRMTAEAADFLAEQTEGNLLAAQQELNRMILAGVTDIDLNTAQAEITDNSRHNVFDLIETAMAGGTRRATHALDGLEMEGAEPVRLLAALLWDLRRVSKALAACADSTRPDNRTLVRHGLFGSRQEAVRKLCGRVGGLNGVHLLLAMALRVEKVLKSGNRESSWRGLRWLFVRISDAAGPSFTE